MSHPIITWLIVIDLIISAIYVFFRGMQEKTVTYTPLDGIVSFIETIALIWGIVVISGGH